MKIEILFKSGHTMIWESGWDDYSYDGKVFIVKNNKAWVGIYNIDSIISIEVI